MKLSLPYNPISNAERSPEQRAELDVPKTETKARVAVTAAFIANFEASDTYINADQKQRKLAYDQMVEQAQQQTAATQVAVATQALPVQQIPASSEVATYQLDQTRAKINGLGRSH